MADESPADEDESLITPAMRAAVGVEDAPIVIHISRELVRRMAEALDEDDPALLAALASGESRPEVPPWAIFTHYSKYRPGRVPDAPERGLMAADEMTMLAPVRVGDTLRVVRRVADVQERIGGRVGHSLFVHHEWTYTNQDGVEVARTRRTVTYFKGKHTGE